jgi:hypothetical protein
MEFLGQFCIFNGHWVIFCFFGIFSPVLVYCVKINLASLHNTWTRSYLTMDGRRTPHAKPLGVSKKSSTHPSQRRKNKSTEKKISGERMEKEEKKKGHHT